MSVSERPYVHDIFAAEAVEAERAVFIRRTYTHLAGAVVVFAGLVAILLHLPFAEAYSAWALSGWNMFLVIGGFMLVSWIAESWARSSVSIGTQYFGLGVYIVAEALLFTPLLFIAWKFGGAHVIKMAAGATVMVFATLTMIVFTTKKDFSFLGSALMLGVLGLLGFMVAAAIFGFSTGNLIAWFGVVLAGGFILYDTSNVLHHYRTSQYVAASLALFASVALLFWYLVQLFLWSRD